MSNMMHFGTPLDKAKAVVILLHGRGGSADDILSLAPELDIDQQLAFLAPQAKGNSWYPYSFLAPIADNEPWLSSALGTVKDAIAEAASAGIPIGRTIIAGFSQGACLATEFIARNPTRYGGLIAFTGGLIGPPESELKHAGKLSGTPALFASGDPDPHVPWSRVETSARILSEMGSLVELQRYPGRPHTVSSAELVIAKALIRKTLLNCAAQNAV